MKQSWINMLTPFNRYLVSVIPHEFLTRIQMGYVFAASDMLVIRWHNATTTIGWNTISKLTLSANPFPYKEALPTLTIELKS